MALFKTIKMILYETIHRNKKSVEQIADEIGISASYLYRAGLPLDESGVKFPLDYVIPLMKATNDYGILEHLAQVCGYIVIKQPRVRNPKVDGIILVSDYQDITTDAVRKLKKFLDKPDKTTYEEVVDALQKVMQRSAEAKKYCEKTYSGQMELEL